MAALSRALVWIHAAGLHEVCSGSLLGRCGVCRLLRDLRLSARTGRRFHRLLTGTIETRGSLLGILLDGLSLLGTAARVGLRYGIKPLARSDMATSAGSVYPTSEPERATVPFEKAMSPEGSRRE